MAPSCSPAAMCGGVWSAVDFRGGKRCIGFWLYLLKSHDMQFIKYFNGLNGHFLPHDMIYLLTAIGLSPGGSTHLHTNNAQNNTNNNRKTQITTNVEECVPCPVFASFTLEFALQLRNKHGKTSVRVRKTSVRVQYTYYQNTHTCLPRHWVFEKYNENRKQNRWHLKDEIQ